LRKAGSLAGTALPVLTRALFDSDLKVRIGAALTLGGIGPSARGAVPQLMMALKDKHRFFVHLVGWALGQVGGAAVPALTQALIDGDQEIRQDAAGILERIRRDAQAQVSTRIACVPGTAGPEEVTPLFACP